MKVGSLFSGIGGFDLGLERAGMTVAWQCEIDPWCQRVLARHWPDVKRYGDIKEIDPHELEPVDLVCGGFPCQPVSRAGRRMAQADDRWLWPEFARVVRGVRPRYVLVENVPGLLAHGMGDVLGELATLGFDAEWESIPAAAVGAPHIRDRVWIMAHAARGCRSDEQDGGDPSGQSVGPVAGASGRTASRCAAEGDRIAGRSAGVVEAHVADTGGERREWGSSVEGTRRKASERGEAGDHAGHGRLAQLDDAGGGRYGAPHEAVFPRRRSPELSGWWAAEPDVGRVAHGIPGRVDRLRGLGNAVVPQVAEWIGRRVMEVAA